jgi:hypothetical protein
MKKGKAQKDILYLSISIFVVVVLWIGFNLYHAHATSTIAPEIQAKIEKIDPAFDTATLQKLEERQRVNPVYELTNASSGANLTPSPTAQEQSPSTASATTQPTGSLERLGQ